MLMEIWIYKWTIALRSIGQSKTICVWMLAHRPFEQLNRKALKVTYDLAEAHLMIQGWAATPSRQSRSPGSFLSSLEIRSFASVDRYAGNLKSTWPTKCNNCKKIKLEAPWLFCGRCRCSTLLQRAASQQGIRRWARQGSKGQPDFVYLKKKTPKVWSFAKSPSAKD